MTSKNKISFLLLIFLNILLIFKTSSDYDFKNLWSNDVIEVNGLQSIYCPGTLEVIYLDDFTKGIKMYTFFSSDVEEDVNGAYTNSISYRTLKYKDQFKVPISEQYIILWGNGYVTNRGSKTEELKLNTLSEVKIDSLKSKFFNFKGNGNYVEVILSHLDVYVEGYPSKYYSYGFFLDGLKEINVVNYYINTQKVTLLYTYRKSDNYIIDTEKGDTITYIFSQKFTYQVSNSLAQQYYNLGEGIILFGGNTAIDSQQCYIFSKSFNSTHALFYIKPNYMYQIFELEPYDKEGTKGQISAKGVKPTIVYNFPTSFNEYKVEKGIAPQYFRINIGTNFYDNFIFNFGTNVEWFEGTMFNSNYQLNIGKNLSSVSISGKDAGKTYTAIFYKDGKFTPQKEINSEELNQYEYKSFALKSGEEKAFIYKKSGSKNTIVKFENGYKGNKVKIYIYNYRSEVIYNPSTQKYSGFLKELSNWEEITINSDNVFLIIQANEKYEDYISFRSDYLILQNENPLEFNSFNLYNFIDFSLSLESGENVIEIVSNVKEFEISVYKDKVKEKTCNDNKACRLLVNNIGNSNYFLYVKNKDKEITIKSPKLYILQYQKKEYYEISNEVSNPKYFLLPFEFKFKFKDTSLISNINLNKEFIINFEGPQSSNGYNIELDYNNELPKKTIETLKTRDYGHYYFNLKNKNDISDLIITVKGKWDESTSLHYDKFLLRYGGPYLLNIDNANLEKEISEGNIVYFKVKNNISDKKYLISIPTEAKIIVGNLFKENGQLNDITKETKRYMLNSEFFESMSDIITLEYKGLFKAEIYSELLNGYIIENRKSDDYKTYTLDFQSNNIVYYLGFYNNIIDTYGYIDNSDNAVSIYYKDENSKLSSTFSDSLLKKDFFSLKTQYNLIKFDRNAKSTTKLNKEFIIFDPNSNSDDLYYWKQGKFYLKPKNDKKIKLIVDQTEKDVYRVVTRSYTKTDVDITINTNYTYKLNSTNNYMNVFEISKGEDFSYKARSNKDTLLFSKVLEGKIYQRLSIYNNTKIQLSSNNILFQIYLLQNSSDFDIEVTNSKKTKFYYKLYTVNIISDDLEKEKLLRRLTLPILDPNREVSDYQNSNKVKKNYRNPYYELGGRNYEYYFALSYEQDLENPVENDQYSVNVIYKEKIEHNYTTLDLSTPFFYKNYNEKYFLKQEADSNLVLTFINYDKGIFIANVTNENEVKLETIDLNKRYIQKVIEKSRIDSLIKYEIGLDLKENAKTSENCCIVFHYNFTNELIKEENFEEYNYNPIFEINQENRKISWGKFENAEEYEIYISTDISNVDSFNNLCYLLNLKEQNSSEIRIITTNETFYEFEKKNEKLKVTVVAFDTKYKMNFVYNAIIYDHYNYALVIILCCIGIVLVIGIIILIICLCLNKKKINDDRDYNISMVDKLNINGQNDN